MPSSHLLWAPSDEWVYKFPYNFSGIVGGYGFHIVYEHHVISCLGNCDRPGIAVRRLCRDRTEIVRKSHNAVAVAVRNLHDKGTIGSL